MIARWLRSRRFQAWLPALQAADPEVRGPALQRLLRGVTADAALGEFAGPVFEQALVRETDPWCASLAARGVGQLRGAAAGQAAWRRLLQHERPAVAAHAALWIEDQELVPDLIALLQRSREVSVRRSVLSRLATSGAVDSVAAVLECLGDPDVRADAVRALGVLGDRSVLPMLRPLVADTTEVEHHGDRGWRPTLGEFATAAIAAIERRVGGASGVGPDGR